MSTGFSLIKTVCRQGSRQYFRQLSTELFTADEQPCYAFVGNYYRQYGQLPTDEALRDAGFNLALYRDNETADYYLNRCRARYVVLQARDRIQLLQQAIVQNNDTAIIERITDLYTAVRGSQQNGAVISMAEALEQVIENYEVARAQPGVQGITLGYPWLDENTGGAQPGDVITMAAKAGLGKSYFLNQMALSAWLAGSSVLMFSMEMTAVQMTTRMVGQYTGIPPEHIRRGTLSWWVRDQFYEHTQAITAGGPFTFVDGSFSLGVDQVDALVQEFNPDIVYIDGAFVAAPPETPFLETNSERQRKMSMDIKRIAMTRKRPIVCTFPLDNEDQANKRVAQSDAMIMDRPIAHVSSAVILLTEGAAPFESITRDLILAKNREGRKSWMRTNFRFDPMDFNYIAAEEDQSDLPQIARLEL